MDELKMTEWICIKCNIWRSFTLRAKSLRGRIVGDTLVYKISSLIWFLMASLMSEGNKVTAGIVRHRGLHSIEVTFHLAALSLILGAPKNFSLDVAEIY